MSSIRRCSYQILLVELRLELGVEDLLEDVLEAAVIGLEDGVLGREVDRVVAQQAVVERGAREVADRLVEIVHAMATPAPGASNTSCSIDLAVLADELDRQLALAGELEVGGAVLVAEGVAADDDRLGPARHEARHVLADDRLAEDGAAEDVADRAVGRLPHLLELEFLDACLVRRDGGALDADAMLLDGVGRVDRHLVVGGVAALDAEIVIFEVEIEIGVDQLVLDELPDDAGHLVAVELDDRIVHLDLLALVTGGTRGIGAGAALALAAAGYEVLATGLTRGRRWRASPPHAAIRHARLDVTKRRRGRGNRRRLRAASTRW
jgi:hypothetical protein